MNMKQTLQGSMLALVLCMYLVAVEAHEDGDHPWWVPNPGVYNYRMWQGILPPKPTFPSRRKKQSSEKNKRTLSPEERM